MSALSGVGNVIGVYVNYIQAVMNKVWDRPQVTSALTTAISLDHLLGTYICHRGFWEDNPDKDNSEFMVY
jgi:hypothetical protein